MAVLVEVCVDTLDGALAAVRGGAGRIELCSALSEGGLTPSAGLMRAAAALPVPVRAMIRPRSGLFHFTDRDEAIMLADIAAARAAGLAGVVLGAQAPDGGLDLGLLARLCDAAGPLGRTLHRVIDVVPDPLLALDQAIALGFDRVLTSGAQPLAPDGAGLIAAMVQRAAGRLSVMPGCGLDAGNVARVVTATGAHEVHAACSRPVPGDPAFSDFDPPGGRRETSEADVRAMVAALAG
ncbi:copper homeostasis protein CutC [Palleronia sp. KMU-117]|uniref:copper homeostasis protein CutC n=1 Tax=Palleronia sp. KMU-117 TaxID=3434108 RepID=UPI003D7190D4